MGKLKRGFTIFLFLTFSGPDDASNFLMELSGFLREYGNLLSLFYVSNSFMYMYRKCLPFDDNSSIISLRLASQRLSQNVPLIYWYKLSSSIQLSTKFEIHVSVST